MFNVYLFARFQWDPRKVHLTVEKRIFRYLKSTTNLGLYYKAREFFCLHSYYDADYTRDKVARKSTSGGCHFVEGNLIS